MEDYGRGWLEELRDWFKGEKEPLKPFSSDGWNFQYTDGRLTMACRCGAIVIPTEAVNHKTVCAGIVQLEKKCITCFITKFVDQFYRKGGTNGWQSECKACRSVRNQEQYRRKVA
jgi:hypothetical protein